MLRSGTVFNPNLHSELPSSSPSKSPKKQSGVMNGSNVTNQEPEVRYVDRHHHHHHTTTTYRVNHTQYVDRKPSVGRKILERAVSVITGLATFLVSMNPINDIAQDTFVRMVKNTEDTVFYSQILAVAGGIALGAGAGLITNYALSKIKTHSPKDSTD